MPNVGQSGFNWCLDTNDGVFSSLSLSPLGPEVGIFSYMRSVNSLQELKEVYGKMITSMHL